jgi:hypothetical protein
VFHKTCVFGEDTWKTESIQLAYLVNTNDIEMKST